MGQVSWYLDMLAWRNPATKRGSSYSADIYQLFVSHDASFQKVHWLKAAENYV